MCTVSFVPGSGGFYLAMNRDEKRDRFAALPPDVIELESHRAIFPREPTGGTWISANDSGVCLALINWHRIERQPKAEPLSRGLVVEELAGKSTASEIAASLKKLPVRKLRPFRLIAIVPAENRVIEWRWDLRRLAIRNHEWLRQHWFSSGFDEDGAERVRAKVCASFVAGGGDPGRHDTSRRSGRAGVNAAGYSLQWLRRLHGSHAPKRGAFSICMHRHDAATVSYTEVAVSPRSVVMRYKDGPLCSRRATMSKTCKLLRSRATNR
ncbi:MAG: NRDE family protein [Nitrospirota bacterium]